jgi:hypothetical protein
MTRVDLQQLQRELDAAGVPVPNGLITLANTLETVRTPDTSGAPTALPSAADPVLQAHVAPPLVIEFAGARSVDAMIRTTDDQPHQVFRFTTTPKHVYRATFRMTAIDAASGVTKDSEVRLTLKATANAILPVGTMAVLYNVQDTGAATWAIQMSIQFPDCVISVKGAAGRTVDWLMVAEIGSYSPEGLA